MTSLAQQQQILLNALFSWPPQDAMKIVAACASDTGGRGLKAYQTNGHMLAERALQSAYPVVAQLLGDDSFADLARALWHAHPPAHGDVARWGAQLPTFLADSADLRDEPYLADVARVEWALHRCATAPDPLADLGTLALLTHTDPAQLQLHLAAGSAVVSSPWPVASIWTSHVEHQPTFAEVGQQLRDQVAQSAVVWRAGLKPCVRQGLSGEAQLLGALQTHLSLGEALDAAPELDFATWLPQAVQNGLVVGVRLLAQVSPILT